MRLLHVVQRYGAAVAGGAEQHCRRLSEKMAARGHQVEVLTSCAQSATTWDDHYPAGTTTEEGVTLHRLPTGGPRPEELFDALSWAVLWSARSARVAPVLEEAWIRAQGPLLEGLVPWLCSRAADYDAVAFFTYLYYPTWAGLRACAGRVPTVLHPTAHDEPAFWLPLYDTPLRAADAHAWLSEEEAALVRRRGIRSVPGEVLGAGVDPHAADPEAFRSAWQLGDRPYLLALGRVNQAKGSTDLIAWFAAFKGLRPGPLLLVLAGEGEPGTPEHPDVLVTGFLSEEQRRSAVAGALALVQPSYLESFSLVLAEAWAAGKPALVQARSPVLAGQARRSGAALCFRGFAELAAAISLLLEDPALARRLGEAGRRYVAARYSWPVVLERYERLLGRAAERSREG